MDYEGYIKEYMRRIESTRPLMIRRNIERINLLEPNNPNAPLMITETQELINLENLEELCDPRDPRFKTNRFIVQKIHL